MRRVAVRYPEEFENGGCEGVHIYKAVSYTHLDVYKRQQ